MLVLDGTLLIMNVAITGLTLDNIDAVVSDPNLIETMLKSLESK